MNGKRAVHGTEAPHKLYTNCTVPQHNPHTNSTQNGTQTVQKLFYDPYCSLANIVPGPSCWIIRTASSTELYLIEHRDTSMPSFTLVPSGTDKWTISRHLSRLLRLGMTPMGLMRRVGISPNAPGGTQITCWRRTSWAIYRSTSCGCCLAEPRLRGLCCCTPLLHPSRKPYISPRIMYSAEALLG